MLEEIESAVDQLIERLEFDHPHSMTVQKEDGPDGEGHSWFIDPCLPSASSIWIDGKYWDDATVSFGRSSCRVELWQLGKTDPDTARANLESVCRLVVAGRLTEWRQDDRSCRYEFEEPDGARWGGRANSLFRRRWRHEEHFDPYAPCQT